jgi:hypothetical protein
MVTKSDVLALLEDGPEEAAQLAEWLEIEPARLLTVLDRMDIPGCANCGRFFVPSAYRATRYCSRDCDQTRTIGRPSFGVARESVEAQVGRRPTGASVERFRRARRDGDDRVRSGLERCRPLAGDGRCGRVGVDVVGDAFLDRQAQLMA